VRAIDVLLHVEADADRPATRFEFRQSLHRGGQAFPVSPDRALVARGRGAEFVGLRLQRR
jgi:hypothetical protein